MCVRACCGVCADREREREREGRSFNFHQQNWTGWSVQLAHRMMGGMLRCYCSLPLVDLVPTGCSCNVKPTGYFPLLWPFWRSLCVGGARWVCCDGEFVSQSMTEFIVRATVRQRRVLIFSDWLLYQSLLE